MITVYFDDVDFSEKSFNATKADISQIGQREILTIMNNHESAVAQFDMNTVIGWCNDNYDITEEKEDEDNDTSRNT